MAQASRITFNTDSDSPPESPLDFSMIHEVSHPVLSKIRDLSNEVKLLGDYPAARGVLSSIWLGKLSNNTLVAVKLSTPPFTAGRVNDFLLEAHAWSCAMHHENVMPLLGFARLQDSMALVSPWMPEGNLKKHLLRNPGDTSPDANTVALMADVARGLAHLHSLGIVYCNLRLSTILVSETGRAYLSSFLEAYTSDSPGGHYAACRPPNSLPSSLEQMPFEDDVFDFGTTMMEALGFGRSYAHHREIIRKILLGQLPERPGITENNILTDDLWVLISCCLERDPRQKPTMAEVARQMVKLADATISSLSTTRVVVPRTLKNIGVEIKKLSEHPIAGGGSCDLYLGERLGSEKVALKLVRLFQGSTDRDKDRARRRFLKEASIWAELEHPRILEFYGICEYDIMSLFMVSPFCQNGNIMHYLTSVSPYADRRRLLIEAAEGLQYLHTRQPPVIHGDLKGANILISDAGCAVLADFGLSRISHEKTVTMLHGAGSPRWMAPELIRAGDEETGPLKSPKTDIYAFGHTMLEVLSNRKPFPNLKEDLHVVVDLLRNKRSPRPTGPIADVWLNDSAWAYCQTCTAINPDDRPDIEVVIADLLQLFT